MTVVVESDSISGVDGQGGLVEIFRAVELLARVVQQGPCDRLD